MGDSNSPGILQRKILGTGRKKSRNLDNVDKSLACFASALQGSPIIVELRNSTFVRGTLYMSDTFMNMFLSDVKTRQPIQLPQSIVNLTTENATMQARMIRMIHLPTGMDFKAFVLQERTEVATSHAQRKVSLLSSNNIEAAPTSDRDAARPQGF